ncbi:MAG: NADH-quinone oxidoreductase subunit C [Cyclobacteriaceae bacterium]
MTFEEIHEYLLSKLGKAIILGTDQNATPKAILVDPSSILEVMTFLHEDEQCYFDMLSCLTGLDNGVEANTMEVIYNLYSIPYNQGLMVKAILTREHPEIESIANIWQTANWHEREAFDLLGIQFLNHPDPRRILLPNDWEGHPLKKDYQQQEIYHGIKVKY